VGEAGETGKAGKAREAGEAAGGAGEGAVEARAFARAGLLGNPSDGYGGKAIGVPLLDFAARVRIRPADRFGLVPGPGDGLVFPDAAEASRAYRAGTCDDGLRLLRAALSRFARHWPGLDACAPDDPRLRFEMDYATNVPRQVGLAGSSAIVVAALRALARWFGVTLPPFTLAELALAAEVDELGLAAGAMDRVVQAYEQLLVMDLREPRSEAAYVPLDPADLPRLFVAWDPRGGQSSGRAHGDLRARWLAGDRATVAAMEAFRRRVDEGVDALRARDHARLRALVDANFDARCAIFEVGARDREMVAIARAHGAAAKLCGSGGAVVVLPAEDGDTPVLGEACARAGYRFVEPRLPGAGKGAA